MILSAESQLSKEAKQSWPFILTAIHLKIATPCLSLLVFRFKLVIILVITQVIESFNAYALLLSKQPNKNVSSFV